MMTKTQFVSGLRKVGADVYISADIFHIKAATVLPCKTSIRLPRDGLVLMHVYCAESESTWANQIKGFRRLRNQIGRHVTAVLEKHYRSRLSTIYAVQTINDPDIAEKLLPLVSWFWYFLEEFLVLWGQEGTFHQEERQWVGRLGRWFAVGNPSRWKILAETAANQTLRIRN